jgi:hypothetical protein
VYPAVSNWNSPDNDSAWVVRNSNGSQSVCQSNGWNFLFDLQSQLKDRLAAVPSPTWDGTTVDGSLIPLNDPSNPSSASGWNVPLLQSLWAIASLDGAPSDALSSVQNDALQGTVSPRTLATAVWVAEYNSGYVASTGQTVYGQGSVNDIVIPDGTVFPVFGIVPPVATGGIGSQGQLGMDCHTIAGFQGASTAPSNAGWILAAFAVGIAAMVALTWNVPTAPKGYTTTVVSPRRSRRSRA